MQFIWNFYCDGFETNFVWFRQVWINFWNLAIKCRINGGVWGDSRLVPYIWDTEDLVHCQFYISQGLRGVKWTNLYQIDKILTIIAFGKPISNRLSPNIRTENMPSSYPLSLTMKYRFEKFVVKFTCLKVFGRLLLL